MEGNGSLFESKILVKSPKPRNKVQRKKDYKNYDAITISRNYDTKLSQFSKLSASSSISITQKMWELYVGILAYPKISA